MSKNWINDVLDRAGGPFRNFLDSIRDDVDEYCKSTYDELSEQGATTEEIYAIVFGFFESWTEDSPLRYLYLKYVDDWFDGT